MGPFSFNVVDLIDLIHVNFVEPLLDDWGVTSWVIKTNNYIEDIFYVWFSGWSLKWSVVESIIFTTKFILLIALLVFVRGGVPRYRYDFLTKIGWIKFLSLVLAVFLSSILLLLLL